MIDGAAFSKGCKTVPALFFASWNTCFEHLKRMAESWALRQHSGGSAKKERHCFPYVPRSCEDGETNASEIVNPPKELVIRALSRTNLCRSWCEKSVVVNRIGSMHMGIRTNPAWMFLESTSTSCYKQVGKDIWYYRDSCSRDDIINSIQEDPER